jgi:citrate synthase
VHRDAPRGHLWCLKGDRQEAMTLVNSAADRSGPSTSPLADPAPGLRVHDERTGDDLLLAISDGAIRAKDLSVLPGSGLDDSGLTSYDPAFLNTASCRSAITYIDGDKGILRYRGYPIEELAGRVPFAAVAQLLVEGELPTDEGARRWRDAVDAGRDVPDPIARLVETFPADAHPMAVLLSAWSALGAYRREARDVDDVEERSAQAPRFLGAIASVVGIVVRHRLGRAAKATPRDLEYGSLLYAELFGVDADEIDPALAEALDILLVLQADHEQNCSTNAVRAVGSSRVDPYSATAAGLAALFGPLHGGANEAVVRMLHEIGSVDRVPAYIERVKSGQGRLMGFGHRVYKSYDPRASIIKKTAERVFEVTGLNPLLDVALAVESIALDDAYFIERKLYPNVDFYSGLIYEAMGLPMDTYTTIFGVARMAGWMSQWLEMIGDPEQKIARPRQLYVGPGPRSVPGA